MNYLSVLELGHPRYFSLNKTLPVDLYIVTLSQC